MTTTTAPALHAPARAVLAEVTDGLARLCPDNPHVYAPDLVPEPGLTWHTVADAAPRTYAVAREGEGLSAPVAAARAGAMLAHAVLGRVTAAVVTLRRAYDVGPGDLLLHLGADGTAERVALTVPGVAVLPDDPAAGLPGVTVVPDLATLLDRVAEQAWAALAPVLGDLHARSRYGLVQLGDLCADAVRGTGTSAPFLAGGRVPEQRAGRAVAEALVAALVRRGLPNRRPGRVQGVPWRGELHRVAVRGACCLWYRTVPDAVPAGQGYCLTCPYVPDGVRVERYPGVLDKLRPTCPSGSGDARHRGRGAGLG